MENILEILEELASNNSGKFKLATLEKYKDRDDLKEFFRLCLDKSINYYIKKIPKYNENHLNDLSLVDAMTLLGKLYRRVFTGNKGKLFLSKLLTRCSESDSEVIKRIIKRDPKCRVSYASVNKVWLGLIDIWPCHLCERSTKKNLKNIKYPAFVQEKSDGLRFNAIYKDGEIEYRSRNGKYIQLYGMLDDEIRKIAKYVKGNFVIDGEGLVLKKEFMNIEPQSIFWLREDVVEERTVGNGIMNKAIQNTITKEDASRVVVNLWDIIDYEDFKNKKGNKGYWATLNQLKSIIKREDFKKFGLINTKIVKNEEQALKFYKTMLQKGKEGAILKNFDSVWEDKRSKDNVKLKIDEKIEMKVIDTYLHKKKKTWIGGLTIESSDGKIKVNVGSGLKDKDRKKKSIDYINKIVTIKSNGIIKSKDKDTYSLFLPTFVEIRHDKDEADSFEDIKNIFDSFLDKESNE